MSGWWTAPRQLVDDDADIVVPVVDLRGDADPEAAAERWMQTEVEHPVDLTASAGGAVGAALLCPHRGSGGPRPERLARKAAPSRELSPAQVRSTFPGLAPVCGLAGEIGRGTRR